jgi:SSS family solute:Na+ symporter
MNIWLTAILSIYLMVILAVSIYASKRIKGKEDFIVAGRRLPLWMAWATLFATWFGAATIMGAAGTVREEGVIGVILDPFGAGFALVVAGLFFAKPLWDMKLLTMGDFYERVYGRKAGLVASVVLVIGYFGWIGGQFVGLGDLVHHFFHIPAFWAVVLGASVILVYTMVGGMWSVTLTDALQLTVLLSGLVVLAWSVLSVLGEGSAFSGVGTLLQKTEPEFLAVLPEATLVATLAWAGTFSSGCFGCVPGQDLMQRVFAAKDSNVAKQACILAGILYLTFGLIPIGMGLASRILVPEGDLGDRTLVVMAEKFFSPAMLVVFVLSLVSIIISTATSAVLAPATILGNNLMGKLGIFNGRELFAERLAVAVMVLGGLVVAFSGETILELLEWSLSIILVGLFVPLLMGLFGKPKGELSGLLAIVFGSLAWLARVLMEYQFLPMPDGSELDYAQYVLENHGAMLHAVAVVPDALWGLAASFVGYFVGQQRLGAYK